MLHPPFTYTHTDEDGMLAEFVKTMNAIADGTPKDIQNATDDTTFERKSRDLVTLYRSVIKTACSCITDQPAPDL